MHLEHVSAESSSQEVFTGHAVLELADLHLVTGKHEPILGPERLWENKFILTQQCAASKTAVQPISAS